MDPTTTYIKLDPAVTVKDPVLADTTVKPLDPEVVSIGEIAVDNPILSCMYTTHDFAGSGITRSKNFFIDVLSSFSNYTGPTTTNEAVGQDISFSPAGADIDSVVARLSELDTTVDENWAYYQERLNELPPSFVDSEFNSYRAYRIKLLDLLILRGRVEKSYAESQGINFSTEAEDPYKKLTLDADTYVGTMSVLTGLKTITQEERDIIYGELSKPVFNKNLFYELAYSAFGRDYTRFTDAYKQGDLSIQVKPEPSSSITVPSRLTSVDASTPAKDSSETQFMVEGSFYELAPVTGVYVSFPADSVHKHNPPEIVAILNHESTIALLDEIDIEINKVLNAVAFNHPECFSVSSNACDWLPEQFVERMDDLVPAGIMNQATEQCNVMNSLGQDIVDVVHPNESSRYPFNTTSYKFEVSPMTINAISGVNNIADLCNSLPPGAHSTNVSGLSDIAYCNQLTGSGTNYKSSTTQFETFFSAAEFFSAVPDAIATYLIFANNGIDDSRMNVENRKRDGSEKELYLGVSYSDFFTTGGEWLGMDAGYGIGAGISNFDSILYGFFCNEEGCGPEDVDTKNSDDPDALKASFFGHAYVEGKLLKLDFDIFRATAFASSSNSFPDDPKDFMPGVKTEVLDHAKNSIGYRKYFSEINIFGYEIYKVAENEVAVSDDKKSKRQDWSDEKTLEYNLVSQTIVVIVPIVIEVDSGMAWDYLFHADPPELRSLVDVTFEPNSSVYIRFAAGVGFDVGFASASAGIEGFLDLIVFEMPLNLDISTVQDQFKVQGVDIFAPKITYDNDFSYKIAFGSGKIGLYAKVKIGWGWLSYSKSARKTLFDFSDHPLWSRQHNIFSLKGDYSLGQIFQGYGLLNP